MRHLALPSTFAALFMTQTAFADVTVTFLEGAPKDRFVIQASADCPLRDAEITIDLATSPAGLIFDTTGAGAGVEVFQPFELVSGGEMVKTPPRVNDGDQAVTLALKSLSAETKVAFTVDVDDTGGGREITVSGSEIKGASVRITQGTNVMRAAFTNKAIARVKTTACTS